MLPLGTTPTYEMNLRALRSRQPGVAQCLHDTDLPVGSQTATTRDGNVSATYLGADGRRCWLGQSSMPHVSTAAQLDGSVLSPGNLATPGILTGVEPLALLARLHSQFAVFVIERDLGLVKLAMHLHDYAAALESGRLVIIPENRFEPAFIEFFSDHPGYEMPQHLLSTVDRDPGETAELRQRLEDVAVRIAEIHRHHTRDLSEAYAQASGIRLTEGVRLSVLSIDTSREIGHLASLIVEAGRDIGWVVHRCVPDGPESCHTVARLKTAADTQTNLVLFLGGGGASLRRFLPRSVPIVSWFLPSSPIQHGLAPAVEPGDVVCAASRHIQDQLERIGVPSERIQDLPPAATTTRPSTMRRSRNPTRISVTAFTTLPPTSAPACGIGLPSHVAFWNTLVRLSLDDARRHRPLDLDALFQRVQLEHDTVFEDAGVPARLRDVAKSHLRPVAEAVGALTEVTAGGCRLTLYGTDLTAWLPDAEYRGTIPTPEKLGTVFESADALLLPQSAPDAITWSLNALACGVPVLCRPDDRFHRECSALLATPLQAMHWFEKDSELRELLAALQRDAPAWRTAYAAAVHDLRKHHGLAARLAKLLAGVVGSAGGASDLDSARVEPASGVRPGP